jgi:hypothetical protein
MSNGSASSFQRSSLRERRLKRRGGIISGGGTFSRALRASRAEIIDAVGGGAVGLLVLVNGNRGTDHAGRPRTASGPTRTRSARA